MEKISKKEMELIKSAKISAVVPCYNEENNIQTVIRTMPEYIDYIVVIDDQSQDKTFELATKEAKTNPKVIVIQHEVNQGVGGSIATGYKWSRDNKIDASVVIGGDNEMDLSVLPLILLPVIKKEVNYAKANRLITPGAIKNMPRNRFWGVSLLSFLTKIASGYWHISDSQHGYAAIDLEGLKAVDWDTMYKRYGQPNDILVLLNIANLTVRDVPVKPNYGVEGAQSGIKLHKVIFTISWLLLTRFFKRLFKKYVFYDFHPLVLFYFIAIIMLLLSVVLFATIIVRWIADGFAPPMTSMAFMFSLSFSFQSLFFAMWMDMEANKHLRG